MHLFVYIKRQSEKILNIFLKIFLITIFDMCLFFFHYPRYSMFFSIIVHTSFKRLHFLNSYSYFTNNLKLSSWCQLRDFLINDENWAFSAFYTQHHFQQRSIILSHNNDCFTPESSSSLSWIIQITMILAHNPLCQSWQTGVGLLPAFYWVLSFNYAGAIRQWNASGVSGSKNIQNWSEEKFF